MSQLLQRHFGGDVVFASLALPEGGGALAVLGVELPGAAVAVVAAASLPGIVVDRGVPDDVPGLIVEPPPAVVVVFRSRSALFTADSVVFAACRCCSSVGSVPAANAFRSGSFADFAIERKSRTSCW